MHSCDALMQAALARNAYAHLRFYFWLSGGMPLTLTRFTSDKLAQKSI
jgi:hypothetical protein